MFAATHTSSVIKAAVRRNYVLLKLKIQKLSAALDVLWSNYDFQGPIAYHDQKVITQLYNDLRTFGDVVFVIEKNIKKDEFVGIPKLFQSQPVEKKIRTPLFDEVSSTAA